LFTDIFYYFIKKIRVPTMKIQAKQSGAVMITVLMLLVVITLMGISSLKQGLYQAQIGASEVAYNTCFSAAESGLNAVYRDFQYQVAVLNEPIENPDNYMNKATGSPQKSCLGVKGLSRDLSTCSGLNEFAELAVTITARKADQNKNETLFRPVLGNDIDKGGYLLIYTDSRCELEGMDMAVVNTQAWQHQKQTSIGAWEFTD
jgi:hypothetical protein